MYVVFLGLWESSKPQRSKLERILHIILIVQHQKSLGVKLCRKRSCLFVDNREHGEFASCILCLGKIISVHRRYFFNSIKIEGNPIRMIGLDGEDIECVTSSPVLSWLKIEILSVTVPPFYKLLDNGGEVDFLVHGKGDHPLLQLLKGGELHLPKIASHDGNPVAFPPHEKEKLLECCGINFPCIIFNGKKNVCLEIKETQPMPQGLSHRTFFRYKEGWLWMVMENSARKKSFCSLIGSTGQNKAPLRLKQLRKILVRTITKKNRGLHSSRSFDKNCPKGRNRLVLFLLDAQRHDEMKEKIIGRKMEQRRMHAVRQFELHLLVTHMTQEV